MKIHNATDLPSYFISALRQPFSSHIHMQIASTLWKKGFNAEAKREITIAQELTRPKEASVLGLTTSPASLLAQWESEPKKHKENYLYWKTVLGEKSDYRDAYIQAGIYAYELGKTEEAIELLRKAHNLDPNFQLTASMRTIIQR